MRTKSVYGYTRVVYFINLHKILPLFAHTDAVVQRPTITIYNDSRVVEQAKFACNR